MKWNNKLSILSVYLFHFILVALSYYAQSSSHQNTFFKFILIIYSLYFISIYFTKKLNIKVKHFYLLGLMYLGSTPIYENDHYRYIWEGKVVAIGENPYLKAPNSKDLKEKVQYEERKKVSYNKLTSIYPPLAQIFFLIASPFKHKFGFFILQSLGLLMLIPLIRQFSKVDAKLTLLILPYLFKEFVQAVHIDILAVFLLFILIKKNKFYAAISVAFLVKILSIIILPFLITRSFLRKQKDIIPIITSCLIVFACFYLYPINLSFYSGAEAFISFWSWNSFLGPIINYFTNSPGYTRIILLLTYCLTNFVLLMHYIKSDGLNFKQHVAISFMLLFLFSPVLHPWYLIWPLVITQKNKMYYYFLFSSILAYYPYGDLPLKHFAEAIQFTLLSLAILEGKKKLVKNQIKST